MIRNGWADNIRNKKLALYTYRMHELSCQDGCIIWGTARLLAIETAALSPSRAAFGALWDRTNEGARANACVMARDRRGNRAVCTDL